MKKRNHNSESDIIINIEGENTMNMQLGNVNNHHLVYNGNIFIAGLTASGKTTHSYLLAGLYGLTYVSGSQIHLNLNGLNPIQDRAFWITQEATNLLNEIQFDLVDLELCRIEKNRSGCIFDSWIMPWRKKNQGLNIYLFSDINSRVIKGAISRRENEFYIDDSYKKQIEFKDASAINLYKKQYNIDITKDLSVFDLIIDISTFIEEPTFEASQKSIVKVQSILDSAIGYYFTNHNYYREELLKHSDGNIILKNNLI